MPRGSVTVLVRALVATLLVLCSLALSVPADGQAQEGATAPSAVKPLSMEVEWVLQGSTIGFSGFFCELLGLSSGLRRMLPGLRVSKSSFTHSLAEPHYGGKTPTPASIRALFDSQLFPEEAADLLQLSTPALPLLGWPTAAAPAAGGSSMDGNDGDADTCAACLATAQVQEGVSLVGGDMARRYAPHARPSAAQCCKACADTPGCVAWSFGPEFVGEFAFTLGAAAASLHKCSLKGALPLEESSEGGTRTADGSKYVCAFVCARLSIASSLALSNPSSLPISPSPQVPGQQAQSHPPRAEGGPHLRSHAPATRSAACAGVPRHHVPVPQ